MLLDLLDHVAAAFVPEPRKSARCPFAVGSTRRAKPAVTHQAKAHCQRPNVESGLIVRGRPGGPTRAGAPVPGGGSRLLS